MIPKLWAVGPTVARYGTYGDVFYDHDNPVLHRVFIKEIGGIGEGNAGEFLIETPCGYTGWVRRLNRNVKARPACEQCLNGKASTWVKWPIPVGALAAELRPKPPETHEAYCDDCPEDFYEPGYGD